MNNNHPDNDLLNALNHTLPEAEKAFQDNLEEQLMAQLQETSTRQNVEDITMRLFSEKQKRTQGSARSFLTLIAAVIAIGITGGLLLFVQGSSNLTLQEAVCDYSGEYHSYQVQSGDTLPSLSEQFGISIDNLANANCFDDNISGLSAGQIITIPVSDPSDNTVTEEQIVNDTIPDLEDNQNHPRVAMVIGHSGQEPNRGAICNDGVNELAINQAIAEASARELVMSGYQVDILTQFDNDFQDYYASLLIELHVLGCSDDSTSGYQAGYNNAPGANTLQACLSDNYENSTGLAPLREDFELSQNNQRSYIVDNIHPATPGLVLSMGTLNSDRRLLLDEQERIGKSVV